ncbi:MAG: recombinase family protein [Actinomycetota bacterium]|nr:recombinase family protein [Actinomycetota bacterium]
MFDPQTRQLIAQEPEPAEAPVVAELYRRLVAGHSLRAIARDFEARGLRTRSGLVFSASRAGSDRAASATLRVPVATASASSSCRARTVAS